MPSGRGTRLAAAKRRPPVVGLAGLVLAAGAGRRFGGPKQLARAGGQPLVVRAVRHAMACCPAGVVVVTGSHAHRVAAALRGLPVRAVLNRRWRSGMAGSLRCGIEALDRAPDAVMVLLCDQAAVSAADLQRLAAAWRARPRAVAAAWYAEGLGVPAIFPRRYWSQLRRLQGDRGARQVIAAAASVTSVEMPAAALDVDSLADLALLGSR
jgi:CTP:molybdopterin cytidylyltransferase MocA